MMTILMVVLFMAALAQMVLVPVSAAARGKDAGLWLLVAVLWVAGGYAMTPLILAAFFVAFVGMGLEGDLNLVSFGILLLLGVAFTFLPLVAVMLTGNSRRRRPRRRKSRGRRSRVVMAKKVS